MEYKDNVKGGKAYVSQMRRYFIINEENKEVFLHFGHFDLFKNESTDKTRPAKLVGADAAGTLQPGPVEQLPVQVHKRPRKATDTGKNSSDLLKQ